MVGIKMDIDARQFDDIMTKLSLRTKDLKPPLKRSGVWMHRSFAANFREEGRPRWKSLSWNTITNRKNMSSRPLQDKGLLRQSVMTKTAQGNIYRLRNDSLTMGSNMSYAGYQQFGTVTHRILPRAKKVIKFMSGDMKPVFTRRVNHPGIPARPFVMFQDEDVKEIEGIFGDYAVKG